MAVATGEWVHVAVGYDGRNLVWTVDGHGQASQRVLLYLPLLITPNQIRWGGDAQVDLDEIAGFESAIDPQQIATRLAAGESMPAAILAANPSWYWRMGDPSGMVVDASPNGRDGVVEPLRWPMLIDDGAAGTTSALSFDGVDDQLSVPDATPLRLNGAFTVEFWARSDSADSAGEGLITKGSDSLLSGGWRIQRGGDGAVEFRRGGRVLATSPGALGSDWTHFAVTYDGTWLRWTVDGEEDTELRVSGFPSLNLFPAPMMVGAPEPARVDLDELALFPRVLTSEELGNRVEARGPPDEMTEVITYAYDGNSLRREKRVDGEVTRYEWDQMAALPQVAVETSPTQVRRWVHDGSGPVQVRVDDQEWFTHLDALGSVVAVTNDQGEVAARFEYDAFGNVSYREELVADLPVGLERFADGTFEPELDLVFLRARYYSPTLGIFTAVDPIDAAVGEMYVSRYAYSGARPTVFVDPSGLKSVRVGGAIASSVVGGIEHAIRDPLGAAGAAVGWVGDNIPCSMSRVWRLASASPRM